MTNKEAIHELKNLKGYGQIFFTEMDMPNNLIHMSQALDKGIEALENQKTGHWIRWYEEVEHKTYTENIPHCKCSECNKEYDTYTSLFIKYCSQCGAKMEGENNAE